MPRLILVLLMVAVVFPSPLSAQSKRKTGRQPIVIVKHRNDNRCCWGNRWLLEPYAGAFNDAYDAALMAMKRGCCWACGSVICWVGAPVCSPMSVTARPTTSQIRRSFRATSSGEVGSPAGTAQPDEGFSAQEIVVPGLMARHRLTSRTTLTAGLHDYIFDFMEGPTQHSVALTAGVSFR